MHMRRVGSMRVRAATTARAMHFDDLRCLVVLPFVAGQRMAISGDAGVKATQTRGTMP